MSLESDIGALVAFSGFPCVANEYNGCEESYFVLRLRHKAFFLQMTGQWSNAKPFPCICTARTVSTPLRCASRSRSERTGRALHGQRNKT